MTTPVEIHQWLKEQNVQYRSLVHSPRFTAQEVAQASHVTGYEMAKVIVVKADERYVMTVIPAARRLDLDRARVALDAREIELAVEREFGPLFPGCEKGAMPPFGNLYGLEMRVDRSLAAYPEIAFNAGSHTETLAIPWSEYARIARPILGDLAAPASRAA